MSVGDNRGGSLWLAASDNQYTMVDLTWMSGRPLTPVSVPENTEAKEHIIL